MNWRAATTKDAQIMGEMNLHLIEDEKHRNPMDVAELTERMRGFLTGEYTGILFMEDSDVLGYALFHAQEDFLYLRQFFIKRDRRRRGFGRAAMSLMLNEIFPSTKRIVVTVLSTNPEALEFWKAVGFADYCTSLEILPRNITDS